MRNYSSCLCVLDCGSYSADTYGCSCQLCHIFTGLVCVFLFLLIKKYLIQSVSLPNFVCFHVSIMVAVVSLYVSATFRCWRHVFGLSVCVCLSASGKFMNMISRELLELIWPNLQFWGTWGQRWTVQILRSEDQMVKKVEACAPMAHRRILSNILVHGYIYICVFFHGLHLHYFIKHVPWKWNDS